VTDTDDAVERFLERADAAYDEYDQGYADADATLRRLERHIDDLRETVER
jgi:archaellum component FlaC